MEVSVTPDQFEQALDKNRDFSTKFKNGFKLVGLIVVVAIITIVFFRLLDNMPRPKVTGSNTLSWLFVGIPLSFLATIYLSLLVHECGHVAAGYLNGFRVVFFIVGPFMLVRSKAGWRFQYSGLKNMQLAGFVYSVPTHDENLMTRTRNLYLGGPLATSCQVIFFVGLRWLLSGLIIPLAVDVWIASFLYLGFVILVSTAIGLLSELWIRCIPIMLRGWEEAIREKVKETMLDIGKRLIESELFAKPVFAFEPNIFDRILFRRIGSKKNTSNRPL